MPEALQQIDTFLALTGQRDLFTAQEIQDFLLDLRIAMQAQAREQLQPVAAGHC